MIFCLSKLCHKGDIRSVHFGRNLNWTYISSAYLSIYWVLPIYLLFIIGFPLFYFSVFIKSGTTQTHQGASSSDCMIYNYMSLLGQTEYRVSLYSERFKHLPWTDLGLWGLCLWNVHSRGLGCHSLRLVRTCFLVQLMAFVSLTCGPPNPHHDWSEDEVKWPWRLGHHFD